MTGDQVAESASGPAPLAPVELVQWERCRAPGCSGAAISPTACLAHAGRDELSAHLAQLRAGRPLDGRGVTFDAALVERVLRAAPSTPDHRVALRRARFDRARFVGDVVLEKVVFEREVSFDGAVFEGHAAFDGSVFQGSARFARTCFEAGARFDAAIFAGHAWFAGAHFGGLASFRAARFDGPAWFGRARFTSDGDFDAAAFSSGASFDGATFGCHSLFRRAAFDDQARFEQAQFAHPPAFDGAAFKGKGGAPPEAARQAEWSGPALAPWARRVAAASVDGAMCLAPMAVAVAIAAVLLRLRYGVADALVVGIGASSAVVVAVRNLLRQGRTGQSAGKRLLGLCLVSESNRLPVGPARSVTRQALHLIDLLPVGLGFLWPLLDARRQTFADKLASTVVVVDRGWASAAPGTSPTDPRGGAGFA